MGSENLVTRVNGDVIDQDWFNLFNRVLQGDFIGRDAAGAATAGQNLGTPTIPWGTVRANTIIINGETIDVGSITTPPNRVISGAVRATSDFPDYLRCAGSGNGLEVDVLGGTTNLSLDINGENVLVSTDINVTGLTAAPGSNNTCLINDTTLTGDDYTKFLGEDGTEITVDNMLSELTALVGNYVALKNTTSNELFLCYIESSTKLTNAKRGYFFNSSGSAIDREPLNNNETLELMSLGFLFADENGTTIDSTFRNPTISENEPTSPQTGDYWYDFGVNQWKRYNGSSFVTINRTFIGYVACDTADCIGARPEYFRRSYSDLNTMSLKLEDVDTIRTNRKTSAISVNGNSFFFDFTFAEWAAATSFETGVTRTVSTEYFLYITEDGDTKISDRKPYDEDSFMLGQYHPYESWRYIDKIFNNAGDEFELVGDANQFRLLCCVQESIGRGTFAANEFPADDTIPQITEGTNIFTATEYHPKSSRGFLIIEAFTTLAETSDTSNAQALALFEAGQTDCLALRSGNQGQDENNGMYTLSYRYELTDLKPLNFSLRASSGGAAAYGYSANAINIGAYYGGAEQSFFRIVEYGGE